MHLQIDSSFDSDECKYFNPFRAIEGYLSVRVVYPAGETTDRSVKVVEFSELMKDMTGLLRMYYQKFSEVFLVF